MDGCGYAPLKFHLQKQEMAHQCAFARGMIKSCTEFKKLGMGNSILPMTVNFFNF
jgi:hypothetical protein